MKNTIVLIFMVLFISCLLYPQGLFDEAVSGGDEVSSGGGLNYELNGYLKSNIFAGNNDNGDFSSFNSVFSEVSLKLRVSKGQFGDFFSEIRFNSMYEDSETENEVYIREAYINLYKGKFDFRIGKQIVVWGRADALNPTNNITPNDLGVFSADEDDRRKGNFLIRGYYNFSDFRLEGIFVPVYKSSVMPDIDFPSNINLYGDEYPDNSFENSSKGIKLHYIKPSFDMSISYLNGYSPVPGIAVLDFTMDSSIPFIEAVKKTYKQQVYGFDFSTSAAGELGLRGEAAYKYREDSDIEEYIPYSEFQFVLGIDKEFFGKLNIIFQYSGKYTDETEFIPETNDFAEESVLKEIKNRNLINNGQTEEYTNSILYRAELKLLNEILSLENLTMVNIDTEEIFTKISGEYDFTDDFIIGWGFQKYWGDENSFYDLIKDEMTRAYLEVKVLF